jgi:hypothetical protein
MMDKEVVSDAGTPIIITARKSGTRVYFSTNISKAQACWDTLTKEWKPIKQQFGESMKSKIATAFSEIM